MRLLIAFLLFTAPALAQQPPSPEIQALHAKLMQELNANLQCTSVAISLQTEIAKLKARIEELEKAPKPPKPPTP